MVKLAQAQWRRAIKFDATDVDATDAP